MRKRLLHHIQAAIRQVNIEIAGHASRGGKYAGALSAEGYAGGYRDALMDMELLIAGVTPNRHNYWPRGTSQEPWRAKPPSAPKPKPKPKPQRCEECDTELMPFSREGVSGLSCDMCGWTWDK